MSPRYHSETFIGRCLNCKRKLWIEITNDATESWGGICKCGYMNIFTLNGFGGYDQRIERVGD